MKCIKCGHLIGPAVERMLMAEVRGESFPVQIVAPACLHCDRVLLRGKSRRAYHRAASDMYRRGHDLLTTKEIDQLRRDLGMTWTQFAEYTRIGVATLKRWMGGEIQTPSLDALVRLKADLSVAQKAANELLVMLASNAQTVDNTVEFEPRPRSRMHAEVDYEGAANTQLAQCA